MTSSCRPKLFPSTTPSWPHVCHFFGRLFLFSTSYVVRYQGSNNISGNAGYHLSLVGQSNLNAYPFCLPTNFPLNSFFMGVYLQNKEWEENKEFFRTGTGISLFVFYAYTYGKIKALYQIICKNHLFPIEETWFLRLLNFLQDL